MKLRALVIFTLFALCASGAARANERWLLITDTHVNPFDRRPYPASFSHDTNGVLFDSAVAAMRKVEPNPQVVMVGGDFLVHSFSQRSRYAHGRGAAERDALEEIRAQANALGRAFPHARFAVTLGNNDDPCGDYRAEYGDSYMRALAAIWRPLAERGARDNGFASTFATGGYGVTSVLHGRARIVSVNSVYWSFFYGGSCSPASVTPGDAEMRWFAATLAHTPSGTKNIVLTHIPPGVDANSTMGIKVVGVPFWHERYRQRVAELFSDPHNAVVWAVTGHSHRSDFRIVGDVPVLLAASLSPIYRNQPVFYVLDVADDGTLADVRPYVYSEDDDAWSAAPSFDKAWNEKAFSVDALRDIHARLANDPNLRDEWAQRYIVWGQRIDNITPTTWRIFWCAQVAAGDAYSACYGSPSLTNIATFGFVALALVAIAIVATAIVVRRRRSRV